MKYSNIALKILAAKECGIIKSNAQFWSNFTNKKKLEEELSKDDRVVEVASNISKELDSSDIGGGIICMYDEGFPVINRHVKRNSEKPYLLFYRGDLSLLSDLNLNVAVIGLIDPDEKIIKREKDIVNRLIDNGQIIVSGLATGCDTIAHKTCLEANGKTIAILPSQLGKIYPAENRDLAEEIVEKGGLLISEYYKDAGSKYEAINRFIERDRLQAMFSKAVILIASYRKDEGDSGSRHAMEAAKRYKIGRYVMYNEKVDKQNKRFGLNMDMINSKEADEVEILTPKTIDLIKSINNPNLSTKENPDIGEQLTLL